MNKDTNTDAQASKNNRTSRSAETQVVLRSLMTALH